jgi:hypothetical protein
LAARNPHVRRALDPARPREPVPGPADPRQLPSLPPLGVRERGLGPRPAPERALAGPGRRPPGRPGLLRGLDPARGAAEPRPLRELLAVAPGLRFKLDPTPGWDEALVGSLQTSAAWT